MSRIRPTGGVDLVSGALILSGAALIALAIVASVLLMSPPAASTTGAPPSSPDDRASVALAADRVATVLNVDAAAGAGSVTRPGDHVDILGYFSRQITGGDAVTRVLLNDVPVLNVDDSGSQIALTLAVSQDSALLLQEAQALGGRPYVVLRPARLAAELPPSISDADVLSRLSGGPH